MPRPMLKDLPIMKTCLRNLITPPPADEVGKTLLPHKLL